MNPRDDSSIEPRRRPYVPPRLTSSSSFERLALACTGNDNGDCSAVPPGDPSYVKGESFCSWNFCQS